MASMIPKVTLFILSPNSITYSLFLSSSNLRTLNIIGCYNVGKRNGFFFFLSIFIWNLREGNSLVQQQGKAQKHAITHLLHYELVTDMQDKVALVWSMHKDQYALHLNAHNAIIAF